MAFQGVGACHRVAGRTVLLRQPRSFSTSSALLSSNYVPPESPSYIRLPPTPQSEDPSRPRVRGSLPIPRNIFSGRHGQRKLDPGYVEKTAPVGKKPEGAVSDVQQWKAAMANTRRSNLQRGLRALGDRRKWNDAQREARLDRKLQEHREAVNAPERKDDRVTRGTVLDAVLDTKVYPDPDRFKRAQRSRANVISRENAKREARRDALVELYMNASKFIVTEKDLQTEIDKVFSEDYFKKLGQSAARYGSMQSTWEVYGKPLSISQMLARTTGSAKPMSATGETEFDRSVKRQKTVSEELTGGRMP
ncbi:hypothetical protein B0I35DRAFT_477892 [Stachybotrys elegans]|uniref:Uncharacterized protein n=1 Tax=Stachybotrys elegans TaxID=80388 RepID=A0A8K0WSF9_9HYPO|nr:hypothetical protein B0I35DRAFT_477892 [Stachybotrys elegans]